MASPDDPSTKPTTVAAAANQPTDQTKRNYKTDQLAQGPRTLPISFQGDRVRWIQEARVMVRQRSHTHTLTQTQGNSNKFVQVRSLARFLFVFFVQSPLVVAMVVIKSDDHIRRLRPRRRPIRPFFLKPANELDLKLKSTFSRGIKVCIDSMMT